MKRSKVRGRASRKIFARTASNPHPKNVAPMPMRGGIRLAVAIALGLACFCGGCRFVMSGFESKIDSVDSQIGKVQ